MHATGDNGHADGREDPCLARAIIRADYAHSSVESYESAPAGLLRRARAREGTEVSGVHDL